jgi:hypothetical protein
MSVRHGCSARILDTIVTSKSLGFKYHLVLVHQNFVLGFKHVFCIVRKILNMFKGNNNRSVQ